MARDLTYSIGRSSEAVQYYALDLIRALNDSLALFKMYNRMGLYWGEHNLDSSNHYLQKVLEAPRTEAYSEIRGLAMNNIANNLSDIGDYAGAMQLLIKVEDIFAEVDDSSRIAMSHANQAKLLYTIGDTAGALSKWWSAEGIYSRLDNRKNRCVVLGSIASVYANSKQFDKSLTYFKEALSIALEEKYLGQAMLFYNNMAASYQGQDLNDQARLSATKALKLCKDLQMETYEPAIYTTLASVAVNEKNYGKAIQLFHQSTAIARKYEFLDNIEFNYKHVVEAYKQLGDHKNALLYLQRYVALKDSIAKGSQSDEIKALQVKHQYELSAHRDSIAQAAKMNELSFKLKQEKELDSARNQRNLLLIGALLLIVGLVTFFGYRTRRNLFAQRLANEQITNQKLIIEEKNDEIISSFTYAKRIQNAILPPSDYGYTLFQEYFVLYKPKDIVSGDFYWFDEVGPYTYAAVADCTGHGVPGAMVSVVGHNGLNKVLHEQNKIQPNDILDALNDFVTDTFSKGQDELKDGMDISLIMVDKANSKLYFSGANNPLWIIRDDEMMVYKADKQPIGVYEKRVPFSVNEIDLEIGDQVLLFSDGYADQFGGPKGKKFKYKSLKQLMLKIHNDPLKDQVAALDEVFESWKGGLEQVDDVCVFSYRVM